MWIHSYRGFNESKSVGRLYHILNFGKLKYVIENNHLKPGQASNRGNISTTRNKMMNSYIGDGPATFFKLELDGDKLSEKYKIRPVSYISHTNVRFEEYEELIITNGKPIENLDDYVTKLIILKDRIEKARISYRPDDSPSDFFTTANNRLGTIKEMISLIKEKSDYEIWTQQGSVIKKDDEYIQSLLDEELYDVKFKYDVWHRGDLPHRKYDFGVEDVLIDSEGRLHYNWSVGDIYDIETPGIKWDDIDFDSKAIKYKGSEFKPYLIKFRIMKDGSYYLEDVKPIDWLKKSDIF